MECFTCKFKEQLNFSSHFACSSNPGNFVGPQKEAVPRGRHLVAEMPSENAESLQCRFAGLLYYFSQQQEARAELYLQVDIKIWGATRILCLHLSTASCSLFQAGKTAALHLTRGLLQNPTPISPNYTHIEKLDIVGHSNVRHKIGGPGVRSSVYD